MSLFSAIFGSGNTAANVAAVVLPEPLFHEKAIKQLDLLGSLVKESSNVISTEVYSILRSMDDMLRPLIKYLETHDVPAEQEYLISSLIADYIPTPLHTFQTLPDRDKQDGGQGDLLLLQQYAIIDNNIRELSDQIYGGALRELSTQAIFIENKFN